MFFTFIDLKYSKISYPYTLYNNVYGYKLIYIYISIHIHKTQKIVFIKNKITFFFDIIYLIDPKFAKFDIIKIKYKTKSIAEINKVNHNFVIIKV